MRCLKSNPRGEQNSASIPFLFDIIEQNGLVLSIKRKSDRIKEEDAYYLLAKQPKLHIYSNGSILLPQRRTIINFSSKIFREDLRTD